jgi:hypothetical protein
MQQRLYRLVIQFPPESRIPAETKGVVANDIAAALEKLGAIADGGEVTEVSRQGFVDIT